MREQPFEIGDLVEVNPKHIDNQLGILGMYWIVAIYPHPTGRCESGWMVRVTDYSMPVDSSWFEKAI